MQVPVEWLREYVDFDDIPLENVAEKLTMAGPEVGEIHHERFGFENSFVARVSDVREHPSRPGFWVLGVEYGAHSNSVLTNLREFSVGEVIPVGYEGFTLPDGSKLEPMKLGGETSDAKILSEADVEYSDNDQVILPLPEDAKIGDCVPDAMGITQEVFKFDLTANRGDCLCVLGIARDLAAILGRPLKKNVFDFELETQPLDIDFSVTIKDPKLCPRYSGRVIRNVVIEKSPLWLRRRLVCSGMRGINSIVDVTNYVMLETGQPLHAFDLDTLQERAIVVRRARAGETIKTIDDIERPLEPYMLVIADKARPVAVAGVMGGAETEIEGNTVNMLLESAHFEPRNLRKTATGLDMRTEASVRFEKGVNPDTAVNCSDYASHLIGKMGWGSPLDGLIDKYPKPRKTKKISLNPARVKNLISPDIEPSEMESILKRLEFTVEKPSKGKTMKVTAPGHRFDISIWEDLAEEIARIYGYNRVPSVMPAALVHRAVISPNQSGNRYLRELLAGCGLRETITFSFTNQQELTRVWHDNPPVAVPITNPLTEDHTHLRPSLAPNMLKTIARNNANSPDTPLQLFELGKVFSNPGNPVEEDTLCIGVSGRSLRTPTKTDYDFELPIYYVIKGIFERFIGRVTPETPNFRPSQNTLFHPGRSAEIYLGEEKIGELGEVHPEVRERFDIRRGTAIANVSIGPLKAVLGRQPRYETISRNPSLARDLSVVVPESVPAKQIENIIRRYGTEILESAEVFDVFRGEKIGRGMKSVTFALVFRAPDRTLTDEEVNPIMEKIIFFVRDEAGGILREA